MVNMNKFNDLMMSGKVIPKLEICTETEFNQIIKSMNNLD